MAAELLMQAFEVALADQAQDAAMLLAQPRIAALAAQLASEDDRDMPGQRLPQRDDDLIAGGEADLAMKLQIPLASRDPILAVVPIVHFRQELLHAREHFRAG